MAAAISQIGLQTFENLHIGYEEAYGNNPYKKACIEAALNLLPPRGRILDIGCGTGIPVSRMLSEAGLNVTGIDISPTMVALAATRIKGTFICEDMLTFQPQGKFAGVVMIFSHLQLDYVSVHSVVDKVASAIEAGGILVFGQMPADRYVVGDETAYDETGTYVENYPGPFMREIIPHFMMSRDGQKRFITSMGLEIVYETVDEFQPAAEGCLSETQQYIIARRNHEKPLRPPEPLPLYKT